MTFSTQQRDALLVAAREAATRAYAPYSKFHVGAALLLGDGSVITGANVENASYGLSLCAETVAVSAILSSGTFRENGGTLEAVAVTGGAPGAAGQGDTVTPCGRCRQILNEIAQIGGTDPVIWCDGGDTVLETRLSQLLPHAFGPANLL
ncbi:MAG: cytidine deaminase [Novosphingobium lindaniclasticum]|jgi:cytidine deaminase|uniref:cytidine deaminase n=1 Tax=Novosphingobium lindaniclasticum TaxID=1329895 RepID=UPI00240A57AF|nr:cytidine deaminase [Novosphingobium lindaniclasticum]MDF2638571.1 cytidine deaminase [Novosphingobium lindaniclasticum]